MAELHDWCECILLAAIEHVVDDFDSCVYFQLALGSPVSYTV